MSQSQQQTEQQHQLGFPSVINFLQKEYRKVESERELWELERADYRTTIATLEAFKKSQERVQYDLLRRVKMLEFALRTERARNQLTLEKINEIITNEQEKRSLLSFIHNALTQKSLSVANQNGNGEATPSSRVSSNNLQPPTLPPNLSQGLLAGKAPKSSQMIRKLLEDLNCSDAWLLLSKPSTAPEEMMKDEQFLASITPLPPTTLATVDSLNLEETSLYINGDARKRESDHTPDMQFPAPQKTAPSQLPQQAPPPQPPVQPSPIVEENKSSNANDTVVDEDKMSRELIEKYKIKANDLDNLMRKAGSGRSARSKRVSWNFGEEEDNESDKVDIGKLDETEAKRSFGAETSKILEQLHKIKVSAATPGSAPSSARSDTSSLTTAVVNHYRAWKPKYVLGNHLDGVRSVSFHDREPLLLSGSEDWTVKLWNVSKPSKRSNEPIHTFRGHTGPVFVVRCHNDFCFSAGVDTTLRVWDTPNPDNNPYASHGHATPFSRAVIQAHSDAIWSLSVAPSLSSSAHILSASSDGTVKLWNYRKIVSDNDDVDELRRGTILVSPEHNTYTREGGAVPTCVTHLPNDPNKFIVSFTDSTISLFDIESQQVLWTTTPPQSNTENNVIYQCIAHPTLPMIITAHEDSNIRFYDSKNGQMTFEMVGHKDAVSCLAFDPNGLYFMSGGHDSSLRVWDVQTKHCVQEIPTHRKKYDESIHSIAYHPTRTLVASAGADSVIKLFQ